MKSSALIGISFGLLALFASQTCEAGVNFGFGVNLAQPSYTYVEQDYYYPTERVVVHQDQYGRTISEHVYVSPAPVRTVHVRQAPRPSGLFSFSLGFFR
jgi:hypothetical protein